VVSHKLSVIEEGKEKPMGEVVSIHIVRRPDGAAEALQQARVHANYGLEEDWRSHRDRSGQLTLIEAEALEDVARHLGHSIPPGASRRQIMVRGLVLNEMIGRHLRLGPVLVYVEAPCDPCRRMETTVGPGAQAAMENRGGVRCRVLEGGELRIGDRVLEEASQPLAATREAVPLTPPSPALRGRDREMEG
jgi:MOSC domain-containing protein YiiM